MEETGLKVWRKGSPGPHCTQSPGHPSWRGPAFSHMDTGSSPASTYQLSKSFGLTVLGQVKSTWQVQLW